MDVIYQCASVTIIALSGEDSGTGLPGVSLKIPRPSQGIETINGKEILSVFPMLNQDIDGTKYYTRAWTMQEAMLTRCRLVFTNNQVHFWCNSANFSECIDEEFDPANYTQSYHPQKQESWFNVMLQMSVFLFVLTCVVAKTVNPNIYAARTPHPW
jgi:hypothetical protein